MAELTDKQRAFKDRYLANGFNATEAAHHVSPQAKRPDQLGYEYLRKPEIAKAIKEAMEAAAMPAHEVLARLSDQARSTMADFLDEEGAIDLKQARRAGKLHLVKKRSRTKEGESIELYDAQAALTLLAKHHRLLVERTEVVDLTPEKAASLSDAELDAELKRRGLL